MRNTYLLVVLSFALAAGAMSASAAGGGSSSGPGKIVCWKDKTGKTVGCGDTIPPEYQDSATKELDKQGITVKQTGATLTPEQKKAAQDDLERQREAQRKQEDQRRQDKALLDTFTTPQEIDLKRDRDLQLVQANLETLQSSVKNADDRLEKLQSRADGYAKNNQPVPQALQDEIDQAASEKAKTDQQIAAKQQEITNIKQKYSDLKRRFIELTGKQ